MKKLKLTKLAENEIEKKDLKNICGGTKDMAWPCFCRSSCQSRKWRRIKRHVQRDI